MTKFASRIWNTLISTFGFRPTAPSGTETAMRIRVQYARRGFLA